MPFIGNQPALSYTSFAKQDFTTSATTSYTLDNPVANANELALFINFVRQEPGSYSASGTQLTLTEATSVGDDMYCVFLGKAVQTVNPPNSSVGTAQLINDAVTKDKLISHNYPAFHATSNVGQSVAQDTTVKVQYNTEVFDTDSCYDTSNYRFTPNVAGKYFIYAVLRYETSDDFQSNQMWIYKNGSEFIQVVRPQQHYTALDGQAIVECNGSSDYIEIYVRQESGSGSYTMSNNSKRIYFYGYRIGD